MSNTGKLVVFSGFSGSGKGTIMKELMAKHGDDYALSVSATTRGPRPGEEHGREYFFISDEEFEQMIKADGLLEYARYVDHYYGTPKSYVNEQLSAGKNVILEIEIQGALKIKKQFPDTVLMFVSAPSADELKDRLVGRGTETKEVCEQRLSRAYEESLGIEKYDYLVVNDKLDDCVELVNDIIHSSDDTKKNQDYLVSSNIDFINNMIHPSYVELMKVVNNNVEIGEEPVVNSRYSIVIAAAKRARQIIDGAEPLIARPKCNKPLSIAVEELYTGAVRIVSDDEDLNEGEEA